MLIIAGIVWKIFEGAWPAIQEFGLSFVWESGWNPVTERRSPPGSRSSSARS